MLALSSCGMTAYEDADSYFKISFPESMKVFVMSDFSPDDPALEEYGIDADEMSNFKEKEGGIFYAKDSLGKAAAWPLTEAIPQSTSGSLKIRFRHSYRPL